ncbi:MAG: hypothetical protein KGJ02_02385 [Verrucomicrobiota bacterium]|nr:hypothetical protein [Verrucomicrobiota bacterium]
MATEATASNVLPLCIRDYRNALIEFSHEFEVISDDYEELQKKEFSSQQLMAGKTAQLAIECFSRVNQCYIRFYEWNELRKQVLHPGKEEDTSFGFVQNIKAAVSIFNPFRNNLPPTPSPLQVFDKETEDFKLKIDELKGRILEDIQSHENARRVVEYPPPPKYPFS